MSKRPDSELLTDIQDAIKRILTYTAGSAYEDFVKDYKTQDAVVRNFEIMGEAVKMVSPGVRKKYPDVPWGYIAQFRDKLIHHYSGVNFDVVWNIVHESLPALEKQIRRIIKESST